MSPNAVRVLRALGLDWLASSPYRPPGAIACGTPAALADLTSAPRRSPLRCALPADAPRDLHRRCLCVRELIVREKALRHRNGAGVRLSFADGTSAEADAVIGADGVHSRVREILLGPRSRGSRAASRTALPSRRRCWASSSSTCTKWWGRTAHRIYPVRAQREEVYFVTSVPDPTWDVSSGHPAASGEVLAALQASRDVQRCAACRRHKCAVRAIGSRWAKGRSPAGRCLHP